MTQPIIVSHILNKLHVTLYMTKKNSLLFYGYVGVICFIFLDVSFFIFVF